MFQTIRMCTPSSRRAGVLALMVAGSAMALPTLTPHDHTGGSVTWQSVANPAFNDNADMHQHWKNQNLNGVIDTFKTYSAWDNNNYRYNALADRKQLRANGDAADYGHGYMEQAAKFSFRPGLGAQAFPIPAIGDFSNAMNSWHANVNQSGLLNSNGVSVTSKINFLNLGNVINNNPNPGGLPVGSDLEIRFDSRYLVGGAANPMEVEFPFESELDELGRRGGGGAGGFGGFDGTLAWWTPSLKILTFNSRINWFFSAGNAGDGNPNIGANQFDFYSVALHEIGHALGLDHIDVGVGMLQADQNSVMFDGIPRRRGYTDPDTNIVYGGIKRAIDAGSIDGARGLYTIPTPGSVGLIGLAGVFAMRRRRN